MMTYTGAVKNLFGMIPGVTKADYHLKMNDIDNFANMLIDVCDFVDPLFSMIDGIEAMEGDGPSSGDIRHLGLLLAGENPFELDYVATGITGLLDSPVNHHALRRGLFEPDGIELFGTDIDSLEVEPFKLPGSTHVNFVSGRIPEFVKDFLLEKVRPYPEVQTKLCVGCGICARNCPPKVISMKNHKAVIDTTNCIRCFCCHELCPEKAVKVKRHPLHRMVFGK
jgi:ferredoxin